MHSQSDIELTVRRVAGIAIRADGSGGRLHPISTSSICLQPSSPHLHPVTLSGSAGMTNFRDDLLDPGYVRGARHWKTPPLVAEGGCLLGRNGCWVGCGCDFRLGVCNFVSYDDFFFYDQWIID